MQRFIILIFTFLQVSSFAQISPDSLKINKEEYNLDFERLVPNTKVPIGWQVGTTRTGYKIQLDSTERHTGKYSLLIEDIDEQIASRDGMSNALIPAKWVGKELELTFYLKLKDVAGHVDFSFRIDGRNNEKLQFTNLLATRIYGTKDWKQYTLKLPLQIEASKIHLFPALYGPGKLWVDDIQLRIDGLDISEAKIKEDYKPTSTKPKINENKPSDSEKIETNKADLDKEFVNGSKITLTDLNPSQFTNLALLGKIWGFLKYHHPAVAKGNYNWDFELFRIVPKILNTKTNQQRNEVLSNWITTLGTFKTINQKIPENIKYNPNFDWFKTSGFGNKLIAQLNMISKADRTAESYYVKLYDAETPVAIFKNENPYTSFLYPDDGYRLLSLLRFWSIFEYFSPYKTLTDNPWINILQEYIPKFTNAKDELNYKLAVASLVAETKDSHAGISPFDPIFRKFYGSLKPKIEVTFIGDLPVVSYSKDELVGKNTLKKGDVIKSINDVSVAQIMKEKLPYITASNKSILYNQFSYQLLRTNDSIMEVAYIRNKKLETTSLKCFPLQYMVPEPIDTGFKIINNSIAYLHAGRIKSNLKSVIPLVLKCNAIIIDMRTYPNPTSFAWDLGKYLFNRPMEVAKYTQGSVETPGQFIFMPDTYMANVVIGETNTDEYKGKVIVLVNEETQSLAELSTMALSMRPNTIIVGSQTAGADGSVGMPVTFPGGLSTGFTQIGVYYPDGRETQRIGIVPDVVVKKSIQGIKKGRDEILEKAIFLVQ